MLALLKRGTWKNSTAGSLGFPNFPCKPWIAAGRNQFLPGGALEQTFHRNVSQTFPFPLCHCCACPWTCCPFSASIHNSLPISHVDPSSLVHGICKFGGMYWYLKWPVVLFCVSFMIQLQRTFAQGYFSFPMTEQADYFVLDPGFNPFHLCL